MSDISINSTEESRCDMSPLIAKELLIHAIKNVAIRYIKDQNLWDDIEVLMVERSFAYELYHQFSKLLESYFFVHPHILPVYLQGEITKKIFFRSTDENRSNTNKNTTNWYPDLVLHSGQGLYENQLMICEIKRFLSDNPDKYKIKDDLVKLSTYISDLDITHNDLNFKQGVFFSITQSKVDIRKPIFEALKILGNESSENFNNLKSKASIIECICVYAEERDDYCRTDNFILGDIIK